MSSAADSSRQTRKPERRVLNLWWVAKKVAIVLGYVLLACAIWAMGHPIGELVVYGRISDSLTNAAGILLDIVVAIVALIFLAKFLVEGITRYGDDKWL